MEVDSGTHDLDSLQKKANEIINGIKNVDEKIKKVTGRDFYEIRRGFGQRNNRKRIARDLLPNIGNLKVNDKSSLSSATTVNSHPRIEDPESSSVVSSVVLTNEIKLPIIQEEKPEEVDEESKSRNRRMFGLLLGTLKDFKTKSELEKDQAIRRQEIERKLDEKAVKDHEEMVQKRKELFQLRREKQRDLRELRRQIQIKEMQELCTNQCENIKGSILLKSNPPIFYKPSKHNEITKKFEEETISLLNEKSNNYLAQIVDFMTYKKPEVPEMEVEEEKEADSRTKERHFESSSSSSEEDEGEVPDLKDNSAESVPISTIDAQ